MSIGNILKLNHKSVPRGSSYNNYIFSHDQMIGTIFNVDIIPMALKSNDFHGIEVEWFPWQCSLMIPMAMQFNNSHVIEV